MRMIPLVMMSVVVASAAHALDVDTVNSGMGEESLAPAPYVAAKPVAAVTATAPAAVVSGTAAEVPAATDVFTVKGIVVTLSDTTGFDRDAALEQGARQSLPTVLTNLGMKPEEATKKVKSLGSAMRFVKGYKVVKESLIPTYTLTADISFNEAMVRKNFGGALPKTVAAAPAAVTPAADTAASVEIVDDSPVIKQWVVRITDSNPASVDKVRVNLNRQASSKAVYRLLTSEGAELLVDTPLDAQQVRNAAGMDVQVMALAEIAPQAVVAVPVQESPAGSATPWQGRESAPMTPEEGAKPAMPWSRY